MYHMYVMSMDTMDSYNLLHQHGQAQKEKQPQRAGFPLSSPFLFFYHAINGNKAGTKKQKKPFQTLDFLCCNCNTESSTPFFFLFSPNVQVTQSRLEYGWWSTPPPFQEPKKRHPSTEHGTATRTHTLRTKSSKTKNTPSLQSITHSLTHLLHSHSL